MPKMKGVAIGAGYFSKFQYKAWTRIPEVDIAALSNRSMERARPLMETYGVPRHYADWREMIERERPDFVDVITPPEQHAEMCRFAAQRGIHVICQKPLAPTFDEARRIVDEAREAGIRFMVHENFRFQPWHREIGACSTPAPSVDGCIRWHSGCAWATAGERTPTSHGSPTSGTTRAC